MAKHSAVTAEGEKCQDLTMRVLRPLNDSMSPRFAMIRNASKQAHGYKSGRPLQRRTQNLSVELISS